MGKSMEYLPNLIGPPLQKGLFKPDLLSLCGKYDNNIKAYKVLVQQKKNEAMTTWVNSLTKDFCTGSKVKYQVSYAPNPDPCRTAAGVTDG